MITVRLRRSRFIPAKRRRVEQTTGLHRTMAKVCNQDGEETFAGTRGNDKVAPIAVTRGTAMGPPGSTRSGHSGRSWTDFGRVMPEAPVAAPV